MELIALAEASATDAGAADPAGPDARFAAAIRGATTGDVTGGLDGLLALVSDDRRWRDEAARKAMLVVFRVIGNRSEVADDYRRRLAARL